MMLLGKIGDRVIQRFTVKDEPIGVVPVQDLDRLGIKLRTRLVPWMTWEVVES